MGGKAVDFPLATQTSQERSVEQDNSYIINYYVTFDPRGTKQIMHNPAPGYTLRYTLSTSSDPIRMIYSDQNSAYSYCLAFNSSLVYLLDKGLRTIVVGNLNTSSGFIGVTSSTSQVLIVDGANGYVYDINALTTTPIVSDNFLPNPLDCVFFNNYFVVCQSNSNQWFISAAGSASTWNAANGVIFNAKADTLQGCAAVNNTLFIFGNYTIEVWYPQAQGSFPFTYNTNMLFEFGCIATGSIAEGQGLLMWLAGDKNGVGSVYMTNGTTPVKISTQEIDLTIRMFDVVSDAIGFVFKEAGHIFYQLTFPTANVTFLVDVTPTNGEIRWSNLERLNGDCHIATCHTYWNDQHLIGSSLRAVINDYSTDISTDDGVARHYRVQGPQLMLPAYNRFKINNFEVNFQAGTANANSPGDDLKAFLSVSSDEGHTFSSQRPAEYGKLGQYRFRGQWYGLGQMRSFLPRIDVYSVVPTFIMGAKIVMEEGGS